MWGGTAIAIRSIAILTLALPHLHFWSASVDWTDASLRELLLEVRARRGDLTDVEIKAAAGRVPSLAPTICAFANMQSPSN